MPTPITLDSRFTQAVELAAEVAHERGVWVVPEVSKLVGALDLIDVKSHKVAPINNKNLQSLFVACGLRVRGHVREVKLVACMPLSVSAC